MKHKLLCCCLPSAAINSPFLAFHPFMGPWCIFPAEVELCNMPGSSSNWHLHPGDLSHKQQMVLRNTFWTMTCAKAWFNLTESSEIGI